MEALFPVEAVSLENGRGVEEADVQFREHARGLRSAARNEPPRGPQGLPSGGTWQVRALCPQHSPPASCSSRARLPLALDSDVP